MKNPAVNWTEGMFLCPQHFQASDRYWHEYASIQNELDCAYRYGLWKFKYSSEALDSSQIALTDLRARFRDGTVVTVGPDEELRVDLSQPRPLGPSLEKALDENDTVLVLLATAIDNPGAGLTAEQGPNTSGARYLLLEREVVDETSGDNPQPVLHRRINLGIMLETDDRSGYHTIPLFRVRRSSSTGNPEVDADYFPPVVAVNAWPELGLEIVRRIYDLTNARSATLADQVRDRGITFSSHEAGDLERMLLLQTLNAAVGELTCLAFGEGVHPFVAYRALCQLVGRLSVFGDARRIDEFPLYDHDDLARIFRWLLLQIQDLIYDPDQDAYRQRYFTGEGPGMQVALDTVWFDSGWEWYVGARPVNYDPDRCRRLFEDGRIDWKLGSSDRVDFLYSERAKGVELTPVDAPRILPSREGWLYYRISRDTPAWQRLKTSRSLAIRLNQQWIKNLDDLQGNRRLKLAIDGDSITVEFAVFAVAPMTR